MVDYPFQDEDHQANFKAGRELARRGGPLAPHCGARTRGGGTCRHAPLAGHTRCLRHAGPKAARAYRQRQFDDMQAGKISYAEFERCEAKRAANRLRDQWKKDPWVHGQTIDLGEHEVAFQGELLHWNGSRRLAPAVLDWLRWKFRRLRIDRTQNETWALLLRDELPRRVREAGTRPATWSEDCATQEATWSGAAATSAGKRIRADTVRSKSSRAPAALPGPSNLDELDPREVAMIVSECRSTLSGPLAKCWSDDERGNLVAALVQCVKNPQSAKRREAWLTRLGALQKR